MSGRPDRLIDRLRHALIVGLLGALCLAAALAGCCGLYLLLVDDEGLLPDALLYLLAAFAAIWSAVWLYLFWTVIRQVSRGR